MSDKDPAGRLILRGARATALGFGGRLGARLLFLFLAGRLFGASAFGSYVLAVAVVELGVSIAGLSTKKLLFQLLDRHDDQAGRPTGHVLLDAALMVVIAGFVIAAIVILAVALLPGSIVHPPTALALIVLAPMILGQALLDLFLAATRWKHAIRYEVIGRSLVEPYALVAAILAAWFLGLGDAALLVGYWCGTLAALGYALAGTLRTYGSLRPRSYRPDPAVLATTLRAGAPTTATDMLTALYARVDLYLVGILLGVGAAGIYGMAKQVSVPIRQVRQSFDGLLVPLVSRTISVRGSRATGDALATATRLILVLQLPIILAILAIGAPLLDAFGPGFSTGYWALVVLALAEAIQAAFSIGDLIFVYLRPKVGLYATLGSILVGVAAGFLLIPHFGMTGAALSVLIAYTVRAMARSLLLRSSFGVKVPHSHHAAPIVAALVGAAVIELWPASSPSWVQLIAALLAYALILILWLRLAGQRLGIAGFATRAD